MSKLSEQTKDILEKIETWNNTKSTAIKKDFVNNQVSKLLKELENVVGENENK